MRQRPPVSNESTLPLRVPIATVEPQFDSDAPGYRGLNPATYLLLALCHDSLAAPSGRPDKNELLGKVIAPAYDAMVPRLAEAFTEEGDGSWSLRLRRGVRSQHGNELTTDDVKWAFEKVFALNTHGAYRWGQMGGLDGPDDLDVVDKYTLRFKLRAPNPHLPAFLFCAAPLIVDSAEVRRNSTQSDPWGVGWLSTRQVAGFGPYTLEQFERDRMTFKGRDDYWAGPPPVTSVIVERVKSRAEALAALDQSEPAYVVGLRCDEAIALRGREDVFMSASWGSHAYLGMNYNRAPFNDVRVRQALSYATPYGDVIKDGFLGLARPWRGPIPTYDSWFATSYWQYETNKKRAKELLAAAGYGTGFETALYVPMRPDILRVAEILKAAYMDVGIDVELRDVSKIPGGRYPTFYLRAECGHNINEPVYDIAHDYALIDPILPSAHARGGIDTWVGSYPGSPALEDMLRDVLLAPTSQERLERCVRIQHAIVDFAPVVFLAENLQINAASRAAGEWMVNNQNRVVQALQFQNCGTGYVG